jgi:hypothetical protein
VSLARKRWAQLAQELQFSQLDIARKQADTWRTGLATLTTLLTAILVIKGRDDLSTLTTTAQVVVAALLGLALLLLLTATMWVSRALAGPPGEEILLTGEDLQDWTNGEVRKISRALRWAPGLAAISVVVVAAAIGVTWFAPAAQGTSAPLVQITETGGQITCGTFIGETRRQVILTVVAGTPSHDAATKPATSINTLIPVASVLAITPVTTCG